MARSACFALLAGAGRAFALGETEAASGVRAALERGADSAVSLLGKPGGFLDNPQVRIPLPGALNSAASMLRAIGQGHRVDDLVNSMNRAAEQAVPEAKPLLVNAVKAMSVEDAVKIVRGGDTSVTDFFAGKTRAPLGEKFLPIVTTETQKVSLAAKYDAVASKGSSFGLVRPEDANVEQYVTRKALDGLYFMIGQEEKKIRADPMATGSAILKSVFGGH
ncbi:MAG TPA: DUF4197 domain-containing protein [Burkholderiaceae bacterium]|nr:DUF4197 domain-containing protein [Burkholderiaceae bacterium]